MTWSTNRARTVRPQISNALSTNTRKRMDPATVPTHVVERGPNITLAQGASPRRTAPTQPIEPEQQEHPHDGPLQEPSGCHPGDQDKEPGEERGHDSRIPGVRTGRAVV